jgi:hypothetical protein
MAARSPIELEASSADTPLERLAALAYDHAELRPLVAANPSTYPDLIAWLSALGDPAVDSALTAREFSSEASDPTTDPARLAELAYAYAVLRAAIAANPAAYPDLLAWIADAGNASASVAAEPVGVAPEDPPAAPPVANTEAAPAAATLVVNAQRQTLSTVSMFRHLELTALLTYVTLPFLLLWASSGMQVYNYASWDIHFWLSLVLAVSTGLLGLGAVAVSPVTVGRKVGSALLVVLGATVLAMPFFTFSTTNPLVVLGGVCLLLAWGVSAPFKGMGFAALPIGFVLLPITSFGAAFIPGGFGLVVIVILAAASVALTVFLALRFEAAHSRKPERVLVHGTGPGTGMQPMYGMRTNPTSIMAIIFSLLGFSLVGVILGHVALGQISRSGEEGRGLSIAALIIGYVGMVVGIVVVIVYATFIGGVFGLLTSLGAYS